MPDQPRHLAAPRDPDGRMVAILIAGFAAALLLGGMLGDLNATPRGRGPAVTVAAAPLVTGGVAGRRAGDVGKAPPATSRPTALGAWTPPTSTTVPDPRSVDLGSSTSAPPARPAASSSSTSTAAPPGSSSTAPPETSRGSDEAGPGPVTTPSTVPPATTPTPTLGGIP